jgi:RNA polymerase sigma-70 factor (ECF subfamily)
MPTDEDLMNAVRGGDLEAFVQIVGRHQRSAWSAAYAFTGDATEAEDLAQEAFLRVLKAALRYEATASFRTYLYRIVTRLCLDHVKKKRPIYTDSLPEPRAAGQSPHDVIVALECRQQVEQSLEKLPASQRLAIVLRYYEGLSYVEIAEALETTVKAVERLLARAREKLDRLLGPLID